MFDVLFNGGQYVIAPADTIRARWSILDSASTMEASTMEEGYARSKKDWDYFWNLFLPKLVGIGR